MRVWGRIYPNNSNTADTYSWAEVSTNPQGSNDMVYATAFCQVLQLQTNESPFYADYGIPVKNSLSNQVFPDYNVYLMQKRYSPFFGSLLVQPKAAVNQNNSPTPVYDVQITTVGGNNITKQVAI